jgi:hypothetical protein
MAGFWYNYLLRAGMISINRVLEHTIHSKKIVLYNVITDSIIKDENEFKNLGEVKKLLSECCESSITGKDDNWNVEVVIDI